MTSTSGRTYPVPMRNTSSGAAGFVWLSLGVVALLLYDPAGDPLMALQAVCVLSIAFGVWAFWSHGGPQITAPGMFCAASAAFVGYAGLWWGKRLGTSVPVELLHAATAGYLVTVALYYVFWYPTREATTLVERDRTTALWAVTFGFILTAASLAAVVAIPAAYRVAEAVGYVGIPILTFGLTGIGRFRLVSPRSIVVAVVVGTFVAITFDGFGRLPVIAVGAAVAIIFASRQHTRALKAAALIGAPAASALLTALRTDIVAGGVAVEGAIDSDVGGIWTFGRLIGLGSELEFADGESFWATAVLWFPRALWETKPVGAGTEMVVFLEPQLAGTGHSMVATTFGEWYYNFGWLGVVAMILPVGLAVAWLDRRRVAFTASALDSRRSILLATLVVMTCASMTDFVWSGAHTLAARMILPAIVIAVLIVLVGREKKVSDPVPSVAERIKRQGTRP